MFKETKVEDMRNDQKAKTMIKPEDLPAERENDMMGPNLRAA
ncbi:hypothetical protein [Paenibacillus lemnae]|nr:hypothetical protein [Paenibacillus lemnae]